MKNHFLCLLFLLLGSITTVAQQRVTGNVSDTDGYPLIGVTILEAGTASGTTTDIDGNFAIDVADGASLVFSYTGYGSQTLQVGAESVINLVMEEGVALDEVVVTALGIERDKKALAYSVTEIGGDNASQARAMNVIQSLSGKVAGVNVAGTATGAGGSTRVVIRGNASLGGNNQPLYVVDGVPIDNSNLGSAGMWGGQDWGDGISSLNPDDIESYTILKGNTAAALYGYRASNGVILITTKSGKKRKGIGVEFNSQFRSETVVNHLDYQKEYGHGQRGEKPSDQTVAFENGLYAWGGALDGSSVVQFDGVSRPYSDAGDNISRFYDSGLTFANTLALTGGDENYNFRFSGSAVNNSDIVPNSGLDRYTFNTKINSKFGEKLTATIGATYVNEKVENRPRLSDSPGNSNYTVWSLPASINVDDLKGSNPDKLGADENGNELQFNDNVFVTNPWWGTYQFEANSTKKRLMGNLTLKYDITDGLFARGRVGMDQYNRRRRNLTPYGTAFSAFGQLDESSLNFQELNTELMLGYNKNLTDNLNINLFVGANQQKNSNENLGGSGNNFSVPYLHTLNNLANRGTTYSIGETQVNSVFGSAEVGLNNAIYLTATGRNDWFSTLTNSTGDSDNDKFYYSIGASFVLSDMMDLPKDIDFAKFRASYAQVGGVGQATNPYQLDLSYGVFGQGHLGQALGGVSNGSIPNANLTPLLATEIEFGLDFRLFNNRLGADIAYYNKVTNDDILNASVSFTSGYGSKTVNLGEITNQGLEFLVYGTPIKNKDFSWDISFNFANNTNEVVRLLTEAQDEESIRVGESRTRNAYIEHVEGLPYSQISGFSYERDASGNIVLDDDGLPMQGEFKNFGTGVHPTSFGISNTFNYKNLSLSILIDGKNGGYIYGATNAYGYFRGLHQATLDGRGTGIGQVASADVQDYYQRIAFNISEQFVQKADFLKLRELVLSYNVPKSALGNLPIGGLSIGVAGRNLALLSSSVDNIDPESTYSSGNAQGLEMFGVPATRSLQFNLGVKF